MTQPAVTFQIRQLEEQFNTRLFDRTHNRVSLTVVGKRVYEYSDRILNLYEDMTRSITEMTGDVSGVVTLGASTTVAEYMLPSLLGEFKNKHQETSIRLRVSNTEEIVTMVENNDIDLGVVEGSVNNKSLMVEMCRMDQLAVIMPPEHHLAGNSVLSVDDILAVPFIIREPGSGTQETISNYINNFGGGQFLNVVLELGSPEAIKGAVEAGMGISIMSRATINKELQLKTLVAIDLHPALERPFSFVRQRHKFRTHAMDELLSFAQEYCKQ